MKTLKLSFIFAFVLIFANPSHAQTNALTALKNDLLDDKITRVEILHMPDADYMVSITPDMLNNEGPLVWIQMSGNIRTTLLKAIENTTITASNKPGDLRWGAVFYDGNSNALHSIYLDKRYINTRTNQGQIDDHIVTVNDALISWFETNFVTKGEKP